MFVGEGRGLWSRVNMNIYEYISYFTTESNENIWMHNGWLMGNVFHVLTLFFVCIGLCCCSFFTISKTDEESG